MKKRLLKLPAQKERGQALVLIAVSFVVILAFVGLVVDVGQVFIQYAYLRRAVDSASLSAAAQFREFRTLAQMTQSANEFLRLNGIDDATAVVEICPPTATPPFSDPVLCTSPWRRKLVRVRADNNVQLTFLSLVGLHEVTISAEAIGEAASLDVILVLDTSQSMAYDSGTDDPATCNPNCQPFADVRSAAAGFVDNMYFPYDRVAIVTFDQGAAIVQPLTDQKADALNAINSLVLPGKIGNPPCDFAIPDQLNNSGCANTNIGGGLLRASAALSDPNFVRADSIWVVVLLTDGAANRTDPMPGFPNGYCPSSTWIQAGCFANCGQPGYPDCYCPICRDIDGTDTRHDFDSEPSLYDAEDYARDRADELATLSNRDMIIFTIGLGDQVVSTLYGTPNAGEQLLEYIADVGTGAYFASATADDLGAIFEDIAQRIFTRITH
ncbi:MAG TPA: VWA domain-containing protein [Anaerolineales bacterium]|nr:VWA domain-containing protein [Anaerolineales bacterium]